MAVAKETKTKTKPKRKWIEGKEYKCVKSASCGYTENQVYTCKKDDEGKLYFDADDGFKDFCSNLVSSFKEA